jgi:Methyltransferase domain
MALDLDHHLCQLADLLYARNGILRTHPNDLDLSVLPSAWVVPSQDLLEYYITGSHLGSILPGDLKDLLDCIRTLQLSRLALDMPKDRLMSMKSAKGMSPKKAHEVQRMASYIKALVEANDGFGPGPLRIVDVGAGQGYLTRALAQLFPSGEILALDADAGQTVGAETKLGKQNSTSIPTNPRITHKTALIKPASLLDAVDEWVVGTGSDQRVPVLFVALHACGSLTPDTLRAVTAARKSRPWYPCAAVIVGCCYNLMYPGGMCDVVTLCFCLMLAPCRLPTIHNSKIILALHRTPPPCLSIPSCSSDPGDLACPRG